MLCSRCGKEIGQDSKVCPHCGTPSATADPLIGRTLDNKYRIDGVLGTGGMGTVYLATRLLIDDQVAVKVLHTERLTDPHAIERFRREAQAAARLKHPNVVTIYDFALTADRMAYIVMELVEGRSLRTVIKQQAPFPAAVAADIISQVSAALDEAHRQNIIHRDLKPDNIIISEASGALRVKVLDFGIAKLRDAATGSTITQTGTVIGTPHYMSPEQCMGEELDNRSDIYSLGIVLYEMLIGKVPFDAPSLTAIVLQQVTNRPPSIRERNPAISPSVEQVVMSALEKDRGKRPQTAGALARELVRAANTSYAATQIQQHPITNEVPTVRTERSADADPGPTKRITPQPLMGEAGAWTPPYIQQQPERSRRGLIAVVIISVIVAIGALAAAAYVFLIRDKQKADALVASNNSRAAIIPNTNGARPLNFNAANLQGNQPVTQPPWIAQAKEQVMARLQAWASALNHHDFDSYMSNYASTLDVYFGRTNVPLDTVRNDKARAFTMFSSFDVRLTNIDIDVRNSPSGGQAQATFDKTWTFTGQTTSSGSVQARLLFTKATGVWLINGEKDLKLYYKN